MKLSSLLLVLVLSLGTCGNVMDDNVRRYNAESQCWEVVSVRESRRGSCTQAFTYAKRRGRYYLFSDGCLPLGFKEVDSSDSGLDEIRGAGGCS